MASKIQCLENIEIAEQIIRCLEKISQDFGEVILNSSCIQYLVQFIDFFEFNIQKSILTLISNSIKFIRNET